MTHYQADDAASYLAADIRNEQDRHFLHFALKVIEIPTDLDKFARAQRIKDELANIFLSKAFVENGFKFDAQSNFGYQPLLRLFLMQLGAFGWLPGQREDIHSHQSFQGGNSCAFIRIVSGTAQHDVYNLLGVCPASGKILISHAYSKELKAGEVDVVYADQAHAIGTKEDSLLKTIHYYDPPIENNLAAQVRRFKILPLKAG